MFNKLRHFKNTQGDDYSVSLFCLNLSNLLWVKFKKFVKYPESCGPYKINKIRDLTVGVQIDFGDHGKKSTPVSQFLSTFKVFGDALKKKIRNLQLIRDAINP